MNLAREAGRLNASFPPFQDHSTFQVHCNLCILTPVPLFLQSLLDPKDPTSIWPVGCSASYFLGSIPEDTLVRGRSLPLSLLLQIQSLNLIFSFAQDHLLKPLFFLFLSPVKSTDIPFIFPPHIHCFFLALNSRAHSCKNKDKSCQVSKKAGSKTVPLPLFLQI